ncbi:hypothetical protein BC940DRAFT_295595 [Gongronella butleri]|nr:hypothetical protein BC940DRAFT_295595 [Gongronella butleri]
MTTPSSDSSGDARTASPSSSPVVAPTVSAPSAGAAAAAAAASTTPRVLSPVSPAYPPYGYIDQTLAYEIQANGGASGYEQTYVFYPVSPQFYYQEYPSYPGSPVLHPQSPPMNPTSPPFSPTYQYHHHPHHHHHHPAAHPHHPHHHHHHPHGMPPHPQQQQASSSGQANGASNANAGPNTTLSPTTAYVLPPHSMHPPFPPLHISSPVLTPVGSSPPMVGPYYDGRKRHPHHHHHHAHPSSSSSAKSNSSQDETPIHHPLNVYVRGLSPSTTDDSFLELCKAYGNVTSSKAILDQKSGECKGYGFAMYEQEDECQSAIQGLNNAGLQASFARVGQESFSSRLRNLQDEFSTNIYISNLPLDMTEQKLEELFHPLQTVSNRILRDPQTGISRGVGFARMLDRPAAIGIIERFNGHVIDGSSAPLQVRFADSPAQKKLKNQTSRKRMVRSRDFQSMAGGFPMRHMPVTPETMLGIAPANSAYPVPAYMGPPPHHHLVSSAPEGDTTDADLIDLTSSVEKDLKITESTA